MSRKVTWTSNGLPSLVMNSPFGPPARNRKPQLVKLDHLYRASELSASWQRRSPLEGSLACSRWRMETQLPARRQVPPVGSLHPRSPPKSRKVQRVLRPCEPKCICQMAIKNGQSGRSRSNIVVCYRRQKRFDAVLRCTKPRGSQGPERVWAFPSTPSPISSEN